MSGPLRVCVIGAGAAGLCACRHLATDTSKFLPVVFEQTKSVGGTWVYNETVGTDANGFPIHSSMYHKMRTNLPKEVMAFPDFAFKESDHSFLHHSEVREYFEDYCKHFDLQKFIKFETRIKSVKPLATGNKMEWEVSHHKVSETECQTSTFDAIMVCNGHYSLPTIPDIPDLNRFEGVMFHSHDYRTPTPFSGLRVIVLGAAASGIDIGIEICGTAKQVLLSHNGPRIPSKLPDNMTQVSGIKSFRPPSTFVLNDNSEVEVDSILMCTGYEFSFPFLDPSCHVQSTGKQVNPLYKHMFHTEFPTMCFIGIPFQICPFPQFNLQVQVFLKTLTGDVILPTREEMNEDTRKEKEAKRAKGIPDRHFHKMGILQWDYNRELAAMAKIDEVPLNIETLYNDVSDRRMVNILGYKDDVYKFDGKKYERKI